MERHQLILIFVIVAVAGAVRWLATRWHRARQPALHESWGRATSVQALDDLHADEAWRAERDGQDPEVPSVDALDERTWQDLDLDRVIATLDRSRTTLGRQRLYARLRNGEPWPNWAARTVELCLADVSFREAIAAPLVKAGRTLGRRFWPITRPDAVVLRWWYSAFPLLAMGMLASVVALPFEPRAWLGVAFFGLSNMAARILASWQVPGLLAPMQQLAPLVNSAEELARIPGLLVGTGLTAAMIQELSPLRRIGGWVGRDGAAAGELAASVWEYMNVLFLLDANALLLAARRLRTAGPVLSRVARFVGDVDLALGVASLRAEPRSWAVPEWSESHSTVASAIWHPLVADAVPNDVQLSVGSGLVITGANMSGKSTYLRAVGIAALLATSLHCAPAASWRGAPLRVRSLIGRSDDLETGRSYYQVEADGVVAMLNDSEVAGGTLYLLDELLRGTNTVERLAAGEAVLRSLLAPMRGGARHAVVVATHDGELVQLLSDCYEPWHFRERVTPAGLEFDYVRKPGAASTRTAIALLEASGAPATLIAAARERAAALDNQRGAAAEG